MKTYRMCITCLGTSVVEVVAENEEEAMEEVDKVLDGDDPIHKENSNLMMNIVDNIEIDEWKVK